MDTTGCFPPAVTDAWKWLCLWTSFTEHLFSVPVLSTRETTFKTLNLVGRKEIKKKIGNIDCFDFSEKLSPFPISGNHTTHFFPLGIASPLPPLLQSKAKILTKWVFMLVQHNSTSDHGSLIHGGPFNPSGVVSSSGFCKLGQHAISVDAVVRHGKCGSCKQFCPSTWTGQQRKPHCRGWSGHWREEGSREVETLSVALQSSVRSY